MFFQFQFSLPCLPRHYLSLCFIYCCPLLASPQIMQFLLRARPSSHRNKALPTKCPVINFNALVISEHDGWSYKVVWTLSSSFLQCNFYLAFWLLRCLPAQVKFSHPSFSFQQRTWMQLLWKLAEERCIKKDFRNFGRKGIFKLKGCYFRCRQ